MPGLPARAQRLSQLVDVRPLSGAVLTRPVSPAPGGQQVSAPPHHSSGEASSSGLLAPPSAQRALSPSPSHTPTPPSPSAPFLEPHRESPVMTADDDEDAEYQRMRRQQMEQHRLILENQERMRQGMQVEGQSSFGGGSGENANAAPRSTRPMSMDIPMAVISPRNHDRPASVSSPYASVGRAAGARISVATNGTHRSSFIDETRGRRQAPASLRGDPRAEFQNSRPALPNADNAGRPISPPPSNSRPVSPGARQAHPRPPERPSAPLANNLNARRKRRGRVQVAEGDDQAPGQGGTRSNHQRRKSLRPTDRDRRVDRVLRDPKVRQQLLKKKTYRPYFMLIVILVQLGVMAYSLILNQGFEEMSINFFAGPSVFTLIQLGSKYGPCMRPPTNNTLAYFQVTNFSSSISCPAAFPDHNGTQCPLDDVLGWVCGMGGFPNDIPLQWWRFFTAIFMHTGLIHLGIIIIFQLRIGFPLETEVGPIRVFLIYIISGLVGNVFGANMVPMEVTNGANGALMGLFALLFIDLFQNWPILTTPYRNLFTLIGICIFILVVGLLPFIDNYASIGGFVGGTLSGLIFMPFITFGKWDGRTKKILMGVSVLLLISIFIAGFYPFYANPNTTEFCEACTYLDCVPPGAPWCTTAGL